MSNQEQNISTNGFAIGSLIIGCLSIIGLIFSQDGRLLSIMGILLGIIGLKEVKQFKQKGTKLALVGIILNCIGLVGGIAMKL